MGSQNASDAVVIGAGHNGLVAAIRLAEAGWSVTVVEASDRVGGAAWSDELTLPGFVHDAHSMNQNLLLGSPFFAQHADELVRLGLRHAVSERPFANVFPDGGALRAHQGVDATVEGLSHGDRDGWRELDALFDRLAPSLFELYAAPLPDRGNRRGQLELLRRLAARRSDLPELARLLASSTRELGDAYLTTPEAKAALACWGLHIDFGPDVAGGAMFAFMEAFSDQRNGMSVAVGGASRLPEALQAMLEARGGRIRLDAPVASISTRAGRATGVVLADGGRLDARRAVIASVMPAALAELVGPAAPAPLRQTARHFRHGPATMMVHLALDGPIPWAAGADLASYAYVHVAPYVDDLARTYVASLAGRLPAEPLLVVGQTSAVDPTRAPAGQHTTWIQVRTLPTRPTGDEAGTIRVGTGDWDELAAPYADRVMDKLERYAPGVGRRVLARAVMSPLDLERHNRNLVGGDSISGSMHLRQSFVLRPRPRTAVDALYLTGTATWPGAGLNALAGDHAAAAALAGDRRQRRRRGVLTRS